MALAALQARIAARMEAERLEAERLEEQRIKQEKVEKFKRDLEDCEEELRRFENEEDDDHDDRIEESKDETNDSPASTNDSPPTLTIRDTEAAYKRIEAEDESDVEDDIPGIEVPRTEFQQRTTKRALESEVEEALKRRKRHQEVMGTYEDRFDAVAEDEIVHAGEDVGLLYQPEAGTEAMDIDSVVDCAEVECESAVGDDGRPTHNHNPIKVLVGSTTAREELSLPKSDLTKHSAYFASLLSFEPIDETVEQVILLPDVSPELFTLFANFLRFGKVLSNRPDDFELRSSPDDGYHLDKESISFQDAIVDAQAMKVNHDHAWPIDMYKSFYTSTTPQTCGIKTLLVDLALCFWDINTLSLPELQEGGEFFQDILNKREELERKAMRGESVEMRVLELGCEYHDHGVGRVCYREGAPDLWVTGNGLVPGRERVREGKGEVWGAEMWSDDEDDDEEFVEVKQEEMDDETDGMVKEEKADEVLKREEKGQEVKQGEAKQEEMDVDVKPEEPAERIKKETDEVVKGGENENCVLGSSTTERQYPP